MAFFLGRSGLLKNIPRVQTHPQLLRMPDVTSMQVTNIETMSALLFKVMIIEQTLHENFHIEKKEKTEKTEKNNAST